MARAPVLTGSPGVTPPAPQASRRRGGARRLSWFERSWWTAAGLVLIVWSSRLVGSVSAFPAVTPLVLLTAAVGLATVIVAWTAPDVASGGGRRWAAVLPWAVLAVTVVAFGVWCLLQVLRAPGYGTDELAFDQYAAHLFLHGIDPYTHSMRPAG